MLNKDYYYLLPPCEGLDLYTMDFVSESNNFGFISKKGRIDNRGDIDISFPIIREALYEEQNIEWKNIKKIGGQDTSRERDQGLLINDLNDLVDKSGASGRKILQQYIGKRIVKGDSNKEDRSFIYIGVRNRLDYQSFFRPATWLTKIKQTRKWVAYKEVVKYLQQQGYSKINVYPVLLQESGSEEIVFRRRYESNENVFGYKEKIKEIILGKYGINKFSSAYAIAATRRYEHNNIEKLLEHLQFHNLAKENIHTKLKIYKFVSLLLPRKIILTLGDESGVRFIAIISRWKLVAERREKELKILSELERRGLGEYIRFPRFYGGGEWEGSRYFILEAIKGITMDVVQSGIDSVMNEAIKIINIFHERTRKKIFVDEYNFDEIFGWIFQSASEKHSDATEITQLTDRIEEIVRDIFLTKKINAAWMHGDFKMENIILNKESSKIEGIIDWEHSRVLGLPSLDIWYLLIYNRKMHENGDIYEIIVRMCIEDELNDMERETISQHNISMGYSDKVAGAIKCMFILHHIFCRMTHDFGNEKVMLVVQNVLNRILGYMRKINDNSI